MFFLDPLNGGAWPLLVGGVICLVDSVNGRDPSRPVGIKIINKDSNPGTCIRVSAGRPFVDSFSAGFLGSVRGEILGNSRSVMLLNVLGDTRTTMSVRTRIPILSDPLDTKEGGITGIT